MTTVMKTDPHFSIVKKAYAIANPRVRIITERKKDNKPLRRIG
jgi:hypothetical protein